MVLIFIICAIVCFVFDGMPKRTPSPPTLFYRIGWFSIGWAFAFTALAFHLYTTHALVLP